MPNIKFSYLYRDSGNYKNWGFVILSNPDNLSLVDVEGIIKKKLIYDVWFYVDEWNLPDLRFNNLDLDEDPTWHEFESVTFSNDPITYFSIDRVKALLNQIE